MAGDGGSWPARTAPLLVGIGVMGMPFHGSHGESLGVRGTPLAEPGKMRGVWGSSFWCSHAGREFLSYSFIRSLTHSFIH